jgi:Zn-dependent alcohol dehydrogenase
MGTTEHPHSTRAIITSLPKSYDPPQLSWSLEAVKIREPRENEILVKILASGICHTDIAISFLPPEQGGKYPRVMGHEGAGIVEKIGHGISHVKEGDYVLLSLDSCGEPACYNCGDGVPGLCPRFVELNILGEADVYSIEAEVGAESDAKTSRRRGVAGNLLGQSSFAGLAIVKKNSVVNVTALVKNEEELSLFAPLGCGFQTGAGALTEVANATARDAVVVCGLGGVGMSAIMAAKIRACHTIIAVDKVQSRLDVAKELGATHTLSTSGFQSLEEDLVKAIQEIRPAGPNVCIDTTGAPAIVKAGYMALHPRGRLVVVGIMPPGAVLEFGTELMSVSGSSPSYLRRNDLLK